MPVQPTIDVETLRPEVARVLGEALAFNKFAADNQIQGPALERFLAAIPQDHKDVIAAYNEANAAK